MSATVRRPGAQLSGLRNSQCRIASVRVPSSHGCTGPAGRNGRTFFTHRPPAAAVRATHVPTMPALQPPCITLPVSKSVWQQYACDGRFLRWKSCVWISNRASRAWDSARARRDPSVLRVSVQDIRRNCQTHGRLPPASAERHGFQCMVAQGRPPKPRDA